MFESFDLSSLGSFIVALVTAAVTWAGAFLYHKQERDKREIENESTQSEEWKKLYLESKDDSARKDQKIDELRKELNELRNSIVRLERRVQLAAIYGCSNLQCPVREHINIAGEEASVND